MNPFVAVWDFVRLVWHRRYHSKKRIRSYQLRQIKKLFAHATTHSPFYRQLYQGHVIHSWDDVHNLPTIDKQTMMEHFSELNTVGLNKDDVISYAVQKERDKDFYGYYQDQYVIGLSSGTSGNKGIYITPKAMTKRLPAVFLARSGLPLSALPYRILFLLRVFSQGFDDINAPLVSLKYLSTMEPLDEIVTAINDNRINILMAPPSLLRQLITKADEITVSLKRIVTYAEVLYPDDKQRFESIFATKVIEIYQASEGQIASACKEGHLHINEDLVYIELFDEEGNRIDTPHVKGHRMVLTNLVNVAQPLIRYEMNDMIVLDEPCPCGSKFRRIEHVLGRHDDLLYFMDQNGQTRYIFPDLFVRWIIVSSEAIREFQVRQRTVGSVEITIDMMGEDERIIPTLTSKIKQELQAFDIIESELEIALAPIKLPVDKNKFKRFINEIDKQ